MCICGPTQRRSIVNELSLSLSLSVSLSLCLLALFTCRQSLLATACCVSAEMLSVGAGNYLRHPPRNQFMPAIARARKCIPFGVVLVKKR